MAIVQTSEFLPIATGDFVTLTTLMGWQASEINGLFEMCITIWPRIDWVDEMEEIDGSGALKDLEWRQFCQFTNDFLLR